MADQKILPFTALKKALAWLEAKGVSDIELSIVHSFGCTVDVTAYAYNITRDEAHRLKRLFTPSEVRESYNSKNIVGTRTVDDSLIIKFTLSGAMSCEEMEEEQIQCMSDADWDNYREKALRGEVKMQACNAAEYKEDPTPALGVN